MSEPIASGVVVVPEAADAAVVALGKESVSALRALKAEVETAHALPAGADFVLVVLASGAPSFETPDLTGRVASVICVDENVQEGRAAVATARKRLRAAGAALGARELVFKPSDFGYLGLESDGLREKLQILLATLVLDAERLRLRREGWEDPDV